MVARERKELLPGVVSQDQAAPGFIFNRGPREAGGFLGLE